MRKLIFNLHLYFALAAGAFIILMGLTGSVMAFETELDRLTHPKRSYVQPGNKSLSLEEIGERVRAAFPNDTIEAYRLSLSPEISYQVLLEEGGAVYINQYTGQILGTRPPGMEFLDYVHQLHLRLAWRTESDLGKKIMSWAGVVTLLLLLSGLYLWWRSKRVFLSKGATGRRWWFDLHNVVGIFSFVFLLLLAVTGILIGFEQATNAMFYKLTGSQPAQVPRTFPQPPPGSKPISMDQALEIAHQALPGAAPFAIQVPGPKGAYLVRARYPEDLTPGGRSRVLIDQYTGRVWFAEGSRGAPAGARVAIANRAIHTGDIFGKLSKIVFSIVSLMLVLQALSGIVMWWKRIRGKPKSLLAREAAS